MRLIVLALVSALVAVTLPLNAAAIDECTTNAPQKACHALVVQSPHPSVPVPKQTVYLYANAGECQSAPTHPTCRWVVFQETNNCAGLQRTPVSACGAKADTKLAI